MGNLNAYHIARAGTHRGVQHNKKTSWRNYVSKMNALTLVKSVWNRICKNNGNTVHHLSVSDREVTIHCGIASVLAYNFSHNSLSAFSTDAFASFARKLKTRI